MTNFRGYTTTWAERDLRPLLDLIDFANLNLNTERFCSYNRLAQYVPSLTGVKCRIVFTLQEDKMDNLGYSYFHYSRQNNSYSLVVRFNKHLFEGEQKFNTPLWRKIIGKHEFLHCVSALLCIPDLSDDKIRGASIKEYSTKMTLEILSIAKICEVEHNHHGRAMDAYPEPTIFFSDDHFRLSRDKSPLKYQNLYDRFLLSVSTFEAAFNDSERRNLKKLTRAGDLLAAYNLALSKVDSIVKNTQLEEGFVIRRIKEILIYYTV
jgi:hypothetical protein